MTSSLAPSGIPAALLINHEEVGTFADRLHFADLGWSAVLKSAPTTDARKEAVRSFVSTLLVHQELTDEVMALYRHVGPAADKAWREVMVSVGGYGSSKNMGAIGRLYLDLQRFIAELTKSEGLAFRIMDHFEARMSLDFPASSKSGCKSTHHSDAQGQLPI